MATLEKKGGSFRVRVVNSNGKRVPVTIGTVSKQIAEVVRRHIEQLESSRHANVEPPADTRAWLENISDDLHGRIVNVGLATSRAARIAAERPKTVADAIEKFYATSNAAPVTVLAYNQGTQQLTEYFSGVRPLKSIGTVEVDEFVAAVRKSGIARATQSKRLQVVKRIFGRCARWGWIATNPFEHVRPGSQTNPERVQFIPAADVLKIIAVAPDLEWQTILALTRFGGLRCPSEVLALKWEHVNFEGGSLHVPSSKTAKAGKPFRVMPLFRELLPYLVDLRAAADPENEFLITRYRVSNANLRTHFNRLAKKAGVKPWPKPFQNMRASRATEVERAFGSKAEMEWLGHTEKVAMAHYLTVTEESFSRATQEASTLQVSRGQSSANNAAQSRTSATQESAAPVKTEGQIDAVGLVVHREDVQTSPNADALPINPAQTGDDIREIAAVLPTLSLAIRQRVLAFIRTIQR